MKDIVSKVVITQFKAHKSPISALCFDPSGTILVTASVQGHSINVFKIMPSSSSNSSVSSTAASYSHLYRLQRGFTNAVRVMQIYFLVGLSQPSLIITIIFLDLLSGHTRHQFQLR